MNKKYIIIIIALTAIVACYIGIDSFLKWHDAGMNATRDQVQSECDQRILVLNKEIQNLEDELLKEKNFYLSPEKINDAFGRDISDLISDKNTLNPDECTAVKEALASFFNYLDNNGYSDRYNLKDGTYGFYKNTLLNLSRNPPDFSTESSEFLTLLQSLSHFSRILGRTGTQVIKDILENETDVVEPAMALFYQLIQNSTSCPTDEKMPVLKTQYQYAYFFLNTLSGKSYLMRRNSKLRILACYYALRVVQMAESKALNLYGLDPRTQAELLLYEIENHRGLLYKKTYIEHLEQIINATQDNLIPEQ
ncbi:MAG: hypothetical protein KKD44_11040 [Proteobacteria bacterium]|nr:hypothetical protein [Pseudomonadota bacterium]